MCNLIPHLNQVGIFVILKSVKSLSPAKIGGLQALGLVSYIALIGTIINNAQTFFGRIDHTIFAPILFLTLFSVSALISALVTLGYPFLVFWDRKNTRQALEIVVYTAAWLVLFILGFILILALNR